METWDVRILCSSYNPRNDQATVELYGKTRGGESITLLAKGFHPYFFIIDPAESLAAQLSKDEDVVEVKNDDLMVVSIYQLLFIAIFGFIGAFIFEDIRMPQSSSEWGAILALAVICSCVGFTIQPFGQKYITPERAGVLAVFNPLTAAILGILFLDEKMTPSMLLGSFLILISIRGPAWLEDRAARKRQTRN